MLTEEELIGEVERIAKERLKMPQEEDFTEAKTIMLRDLFQKIITENPQFGYRMEKIAKNGKFIYKISKLH